MTDNSEKNAVKTASQNMPLEGEVKDFEVSQADTSIMSVSSPPLELHSLKKSCAASPKKPTGLSYTLMKYGKLEMQRKERQFRRFQLISNLKKSDELGWLGHHSPEVHAMVS